MLLLSNWMLSSKTTSTGLANAHKVAAHQILRLPTFLRGCLSIKEFILLLLQLGSTVVEDETPCQTASAPIEWDVLILELAAGVLHTAS